VYFRFYTGPCWYLDNLAVDFRHRRRGVGRALVQWGLDRTPPGLPAMTESGPMAEQLYRTLGFTVAGTWTVPLPARTMSFPVLRWTKPADPNVQE
jgi:GNAT superfamily N-acetyltransferase